MDGAGSSLGWWKGSLPWQGVGWMGLEGRCQPKPLSESMISGRFLCQKPEQLLKAAERRRCAPHPAVLQKLPDPPDGSSRAWGGGAQHLCPAHRSPAPRCAPPQRLAGAKCPVLTHGLWQPGCLAGDAILPRPRPWPTPTRSSETSTVQCLAIQVLKKAQTTRRCDLISQKCCHPPAPSWFRGDQGLLN